MPVFPQLERFFWFDHQLRRGRYPNASNLAEHFELSNKTAQRTITLTPDRLLKHGAKLTCRVPEINPNDQIQHMVRVDVALTGHLF